MGIADSSKAAQSTNNYAERCLRPVALGRKNFLFVGSERAGHAAAIYYSLVESCKVNTVNPLTYLTYVLERVRDKTVTIQTPDEFTTSNIATSASPRSLTSFLFLGACSGQRSHLSSVPPAAEPL